MEKKYSVNMNIYAHISYIKPAAVLIVLFVGTVAYSQNNANSEELEKFKTVYEKVVQLQERLEEEEQSLVQASSIKKDSFKNMYEAYINNNQGVWDFASEDEKEEFSKVMKKIVELQKEYRRDLLKLIDENGFTQRRFFELLHKYED